MFSNGNKRASLMPLSQDYCTQRVSRWITYILGIGFLWNVVGCSWFISKDDKPNTTPVEISLNHGDCFKEIPDTISRYAEQQLQSSHELHNKVFSCVDQAIQVFTKRTVGGKDSQSYTSAELKYFFQTYIVKKDISVDLMKEIMKIKVGIVGGSLESITKNEFEKIKQLLPLFEETMLKLYPHLGVLFFRATDSEVHPITSKDQNFDPVMAAVNELKSAVVTIYKSLNLEASHYSLNDLYQLVHEAEKFQQSSSESTSDGRSWPKHVLAIKKIRTLLAGDPKEIKGSQDTLEVYNTLIDGLKLVLQFQNSIKFKHWTASQDFPQIDGWVEDVIALFKKSFTLHGSKEIPLEHIDAVLEELKSRDLWIEPLKLETAKLTYRHFILRFLNNNRTATALNSFEYKHFRKIELEYKAYATIQKNLIAVFQSEPRQSIDHVRNQIQKIMVRNKTKKVLFQDKEEHMLSQEAWSQFLSLISSNEIRHWNAKGNVSVALVKTSSGDVVPQNVEETLSWTFQELAFLSLIRVPASVIMSAYSELEEVGYSNSALHQVLKVEHIRAVYNEFRQFGSEMSLFDLRGEDTAARSTREADMFTPSGNGDYLVQFTELFDLFSILWSGGELGVSQFKSYAQSEGCELPTLDFFKKPYLKMECASHSFKKHFHQILPQFLDFGNFVGAFNQEQWNSFYDDLLVVSRVCPTDTIGLETGDQRTMMVVLHYIEVLFSLYDTNRDGHFDEAEVTVAYPRFKKFFMEQPPKMELWPGFKEDAFKFVVLVGRKPDLKELAAFKLSSDKGTADRQKLAKVFAALKADISTFTPVCNVQPQ